MKSKRSLLLLFVLLLVGGQSPPRTAHAAVITVTTFLDDLTQNGNCSLREAIIAANSDAMVDACPAGNGADTIELPDGTYTLTRAGINEEAAQLGDLDITAPLTISGAGRATTVIDANGVDRAFHLHASAGVVEMSQLTVRGGSAIVIGALYVFGSELQLSNARLRDNEGNGALYVTHSGSATVSDSRIFDNSSSGVFVGLNSTVELRHSLVSGNSATNGGGVSNSGLLRVVNSTISGNEADNSGGGIYSADDLARAFLSFATVTDNRADADGDQLGSGGGVYVNRGTVTLGDSILAGNHDDSIGGQQHPDCSGPLSSLGYNLFQSLAGCTVSGATTNLTTNDPRLAALASNGGATLTHALLGNSPAVDAANPAGCEDAEGNAIDTDQRGFVRPVDAGGSGAARCDIGAYEYRSAGPFPETITVNTVDDTSDAVPGNARCDVAPAVAGEQCTLRAALEEVNGLGTGDQPVRIAFDIPGPGPHLFTPGPLLPEINVPIFLDGASQPGAFCPTATSPAQLMIVIDGLMSGGSGLYLNGLAGAEGSIIHGVAIGNFPTGIFIDGDKIRVTCSRIGPGPDGMAPMDSGIGIDVRGDGNVIGGAQSHENRNVISANSIAGIQVMGSHNVIQNNWIGATADGMQALGNYYGIMTHGHNNRIGGSAPLAGNVIAASSYEAILIWDSTHTLIQGNLIGVAPDGQSPLPNGGHGILIDGYDTSHLIGGDKPAEGNLIAHNEQHGIILSVNGNDSPRQISIRGNAIFNNGDLGILLQGDSNGGLGAPRLSAVPNAPAVTVAVDGPPSSALEIDVFRNIMCDPSGFGEGQFYLGTWTFTADASGNAGGAIDLAGLVDPGDIITATVTDSLGNTSQFSPCAELAFEPAPTPTPTATTDPALTPTPTPTVTGTPPAPGNERTYLPFFNH